MRIGSVFSGVGGLELGLEAAFPDAQTAWQVERDPFCCEVLRQRFPRAHRFGDVTAIGRGCDVRDQLLPVELICGGPPCQDLSDASHGEGDGLDGERSGLWFELLRLVCELHPRCFVGENVDGAAWRRWVPVVRRELHRLGYASVPLRLRACDLGAPFKGARCFVVATPYREGKPAFPVDAQVALVQAAARVRRPDWGRPPSRALGLADGFPRGVAGRMNRAYGNAVMPLMAEAVGHWIRIQQEAN